MPAVPLDIRWYASRVTDAAGRTVELAIPRIVCSLHAGPDRIAIDAWVDTGSPYTLLPHESWSWYERHIRWLDPQGGGIKVRVAGGSQVCRRGRVELIVTSPDRAVELPPVSVEAYFAPEQGSLRQALVGLSGGVLAGRRLVVEPDLASARLEAA